MLPSIRTVLDEARDAMAEFLTHRTYKNTQRPSPEGEGFRAEIFYAPDTTMDVSGPETGTADPHVRELLSHADETWYNRHNEIFRNR